MATETYAIDTSGRATILKDPQAVLDYSFDWTAYLTPIADTLESVGFTVSSGAVDQSGFAGAVATAWVSGGVIGTVITLTCHIVTTGGRTDERSVYIKIKER
jgi:hypothetical protein